jgi:hypothetical protein
MRCPLLEENGPFFLKTLKCWFFMLHHHRIGYMASFNGGGGLQMPFCELFQAQLL